MSRVKVGWDWGDEQHVVCVVDEQGEELHRWIVPHTAAGLRRLVERLSRWGSVEVAIERPDGVVVDVLLEAGHTVVPIRPNVVKASRPRYRAAGSKSDGEDGFILADLLRTDGHRFTPLKVASDAVRALRARVRARGGLLARRLALSNQLREVLKGFWPGPVDLFSELDSAISLAFLKRYPTPEHAKRLGPARMAGFLARHGYSGHRTAEELLERLRRAPVGRASKIEMEAQGQIVSALVEILELVQRQIAELTRVIERSVEELPTGQIVMSLPRAGRLNAAQIVAEIGDDPQRFASAEHLAAQAGVVPVTLASGKRRGVVFRLACNRRLRHAVTLFANNSRHQSPWAADVYDRARQRGCHHALAVRILARAWIRVLWRCWNDGVPYQPQVHRAAQQLVAQAA